MFKKSEILKKKAASVCKAIFFIGAKCIIVSHVQYIILSLGSRRFFSGYSFSNLREVVINELQKNVQ